MANTRVEPDRDHSQKVPRPHQTSNTAAEGSEPSVLFNSGNFPPAVYSFSAMASTNQRTSAEEPHEHERISPELRDVSFNAFPMIRYPQEDHPRERPECLSWHADGTEISKWDHLAPQGNTPTIEDLAVKKPSLGCQLNFPALYPLRTSANLLQSSSGHGSRVLTPLSASSLGGHRWTPLSAEGSSLSGSSSLLPTRRPFSSSPSERFTPSTYAAQSPWNDYGLKQQVSFSV